MKTQSRSATLLVAAIATLAMAACGGGGAAEDKAGGSGGPVVLRLANTNGQIDYTPAVDDFVKGVEELSGGNLRIEVVDEWGEGASDSEQQVAQDVAAGEVDLGWVGTRVFDTLGVESFQALSAPMLVDSYALENAVIESGITDQMMEKLDELGVVGLGVLPDGLRKPMGVKGPILGPADWQGLSFGTLMSNAQSEAIQTLGAMPVSVQWPERQERLANGTIQGFETSLWIHQHNPALVPLAPYVTSNVTLWPQMDVLLANPTRLEALSAEQRGWLKEAARDAVRSISFADADARALADSCGAGARFAEASDGDLAALEAAFAPLYAKLQRHPETKAFIERIRTLKESTPPDPELAIPSDCTGTAPKHADGGIGSVPAHLNGVYRWTITKEDAIAAGAGDDPDYPATSTVWLEDGTVRANGDLKGSYSVDGDRITFEFTGFDYTNTFTFTIDDAGNLTLEPVPPMDRGDAILFSTKPWIKVG